MLRYLVCLIALWNFESFSFAAEQNFLTYCKYLKENSPHIPENIKHTTHKLLEYSEQENCEEAFDILQETRIIDLSSQNISSLLPFKGLKNLKTLNLQNNHIKNLWGIEYLTNIDTLILSQNEIEDLTPLSFLKNILLLDLSNNQIKKVAPLKDLPELTILKLQGNPVYTNDKSMDYINSIVYLRGFLPIPLAFDLTDLETPQGTIELIDRVSARGDLLGLEFLFTISNLSAILTKPFIFAQLSKESRRCIMAIKKSEKISSRLISCYQEILYKKITANSPLLDSYFFHLKEKISKTLRFFIVEEDKVLHTEVELEALVNYLIIEIQKEEKLSTERILLLCNKWRTRQLTTGAPAALRAGIFLP